MTYLQCVKRTLFV